jgi:hypothetical protein
MAATFGVIGIPNSIRYNQRISITSSQRDSQSSLVTTPVETLTRINLADMLDNFGLGRLRLGRSVLEHLCRAPARVLAEQAISFDRCVGEAGLQAGASMAIDVCESTGCRARSIFGQRRRILAANHRA